VADPAPLHVSHGAGDSVVGLATVRLDNLLACGRAPASRLPGSSAIVDDR